MSHVDALSQVACFFLTESVMHKLKEAQMADEWTSAVISLVEVQGYEDYYCSNTQTEN